MEEWKVCVIQGFVFDWLLHPSVLTCYQSASCYGRAEIGCCICSVTFFQCRSLCCICSFSISLVSGEGIFLWLSGTTQHLSHWRKRRTNHLNVSSVLDEQLVMVSCRFFPPSNTFNFNYQHEEWDFNFVALMKTNQISVQGKGNRVGEKNDVGFVLLFV